jgi:ABC-type antimicrobial peptide transport system permease subunit
MGATNKSLYYLLTRDFIKLIGISALIAIPFSYVFYDKLFLHFLIRYGSGLGVLEVVASIAFLLFVGFVSIYWQTAKVARTNPSENLRYE